MTPWQLENTGDLLSREDDKAVVLNADATNIRKITPVMLMMLTQAWHSTVHGVQTEKRENKSLVESTWTSSVACFKFQLYLETQI